mmetsp:Transcript_27436/g.80069  ORF Transcript_27436/g.80069 Transcript_27436/m.80069 type:complete len:284 (+) Transcript_27436:431-1282(+)
MYLDRSDLTRRLLTRSSTSSLVTTTRVSSISGASKLMSSMTRSTMVWRRRAPMFSRSRFASVATRAISRTAPSSNSSSMPSACISSTCCAKRFVMGSVRMRYMSPSVRPLSSTRMGSRPWSSASRSEGLTWWKAPEAMKRMWSVWTLPYLVLIVEPSIRGSRSRCTPSALASAEVLRMSRELQILSISSMKTMPFSSTEEIASRVRSAESISFSSSASSRAARASRTGRRRFSELLPPPIMVMAAPGMLSSGVWSGVGTSTVTSFWSSSPLRRDSSHDSCVDC